MVKFQSCERGKLTSPAQTASLADMIVSSWKEARAWRDRLHAEGKHVVFTNGCFDLLHVGHVRYLQEARACGNALLVAVNSDASVRALKGPDRPINNEEDRAEVLLALGAVDCVVIFEDQRATAVIEATAPHLYAKGGDYTSESLNREEKAALDAAGTEIRILQLVDGKSTTATMNKLKCSQSPIKLGVLGSGYGSTLENLFSAIDEGRLKAEISIVLSDVAEARILRIAEQRGINAVHVDPGNYKNKLGDGAQKEICDRLRGASVDLVILAGFMRKIKSPILETYERRILNIHPSLLPKYPGREPWTQALEAGETEAGATVHMVNADIDAGEILGQERVPILPNDTSGTLQTRIQAAERILYPKIIAAQAK